MTSRHILPLVVILGLMITACRPRMQSISSGQVQVPQHITSLTDQLDYIIGHYWDHELPADAKPDAIEYRIYDFCGFISGLDTARVSPALVRSLEQCSALMNSSPRCYACTRPYYLTAPHPCMTT